MADTENNKTEDVPPIPTSPLDMPDLLEEEKHGIFFRRVESSPCLVHTFKNAIFIGIGAGLLSFLLTTNPARSAMYSWGAFFVSQYPLWFYCNYGERKKVEEIERYEKMLYGKILLEGTDYEKKLDKMLEERERQGGLTKVSSESSQTGEKVKNTMTGQSS